MRNNLVYVLEGSCRVRILTKCHDGSLAGQFGVAKKLDLISRTYWWPQMWNLMKDFIKTCDICARSQTIHHRPYGLLRPLPLPDQLWSSISMDFITDLPPFEGHYSKMTHCIPYSKAISGLETTNLILANVVCLHGLPDDIVSDQGAPFISHFWKRCRGGCGSCGEVAGTKVNGSPRIFL